VRSHRPKALENQKPQLSQCYWYCLPLLGYLLCFSHVSSFAISEPKLQESLEEVQESLGEAVRPPENLQLALEEVVAPLLLLFYLCSWFCRLFPELRTGLSGG